MSEKKMNKIDIKKMKKWLTDSDYIDDKPNPKHKTQNEPRTIVPTGLCSLATF